MSDARIDRLAADLRREQERVIENARAQCPVPGCPEDVIGLKFRAGARVRDLISGEEGTILAGRKTNIVLPASRRR